ncbi:hypothetical protein L9F63_008815, partial [Diploptera punctata]
MDIFVTLSTVDDSLYFMCNIEDFKFLADMIQHVPLPLRARYVFCCAPINRKLPFVCTMFLKFARQYSKNEALTLDWLCRNIGWPFAPPKTILDLVHLEAVFDVLDLYLWLSYRFMDLFPATSLVRDMQSELDSMIQQGVFQLTRLLKNSETGVSSGAAAGIDEDEFTITRQRQSYLRGNKDSEYSQVGRGRLTERLLAQGLLTPNMLQELRREWTQDDQDPSEPQPPTSRPKKTRVKRKPKCKFIFYIHETTDLRTISDCRIEGRWTCRADNLKQRKNQGMRTAQ